MIGVDPSRTMVDYARLHSDGKVAMKLGSGAACDPIISDIRLDKEVLMMCTVPSEVAITATTREFAAI